jgi:hypothetical protein
MDIYMYTYICVYISTCIICMYIDVYDDFCIYFHIMIRINIHIHIYTLEPEEIDSPLHMPPTPTYSTASDSPQNGSSRSSERY